MKTENSITKFDGNNNTDVIEKSRFTTVGQVD